MEAPFLTESLVTVARNRPPGLRFRSTITVDD